MKFQLLFSPSSFAESLVSNIFSIFLLSHLSASPPWFVSPPSSPRTASPVDWAFLILAVKKPFKVDERWKESITSFFFSYSSSPRRCLSESRWARVEIKYKITNARTLHYPRVGGWKSSGFLSFTLFWAAQWTEPRTECEHCGELDDHWALRPRRKDARNRTQKQNPIAHISRLHVCTVNKIETNCSRKMSWKKCHILDIIPCRRRRLDCTRCNRYNRPLSAASLHYTLTIQYFLCAYWLDLYIFIFPLLRLRRPVVVHLPRFDLIAYSCCSLGPVCIYWICVMCVEKLLSSREPRDETRMLSGWLWWEKNEKPSEKSQKSAKPLLSAQRKRSHYKMNSIANFLFLLFRWTNRFCILHFMFSPPPPWSALCH